MIFFRFFPPSRCPFLPSTCAPLTQLMRALNDFLAFFVHDAVGDAVQLPYPEQPFERFRRPALVHPSAARERIYGVVAGAADLVDPEADHKVHVSWICSHTADGVEELFRVAIEGIVVVHSAARSNFCF